jgi:lysophospholipase L1-like esterase
MKTILCYGDSNTWGADPSGGPRFDMDTRYPGVLAKALGNEFHVIEEGLCGRTTVWDDPIEEHRNGKKYLMPCLDSHNPLDLVIIFLGTNDLKHRFSLTAFDVSKGAGLLVSIVQKSNAGIAGKGPQVLLVAPPPVGRLSYFAEMFKGARDKSLELSKYYRIVAEETRCHFMDAGEIIVSSDKDGIHFEKPEHEKLGKALATKVSEILQ